jgi:large subunit ribosomal protein L19
MNNKINELFKVELNAKIPSFNVGDTVRVLVGSIGADKFSYSCEGVVIGIRNKGVCSSFHLRRTSGSVAIEYLFPFHAPTIKKVEVLRRGVVRRAKLYYLRKLSAKAARIKESLAGQRKARES